MTCTSATITAAGSPQYAGILPSSVTVSFPGVFNTPAQVGTTYAIVTSASQFFNDITGFSGSKVFHDSAVAYWVGAQSGLPVNYTNLNCLAQQISYDYYYYQLGTNDIIYNGIANIAPEGIDDKIEWTHKANCLETRLSRGPWNQGFTELLHDDGLTPQIVTSGSTGVGVCTVNTVAKYVTTNSVGCSSITDDATAVSLTENLAYTPQRPTPIATSAVPAYNFGNTSLVFQDASIDTTIYGIIPTSGGYDGQSVEFWNVSATNSITFADNSSLATSAAYRVCIPNGTNYTLQYASDAVHTSGFGNRGVRLTYDNSALRWRLAPVVGQYQPAGPLHSPGFVPDGGTSAHTPPYAFFDNAIFTKLLGAKGDLLATDGTNINQLPVGANGQVLTANSAATNGFNWAAIPSTSGTGFALFDTQTFLANGNWSKPTGAILTLVACWGSGGGGGSGASGGLASVRQGGTGGGGGCQMRQWFNSADLSATETVVVGLGGAAGVAGQLTTFGTSIKVWAYGGGNGILGAATGIQSGGGGGGSMGAGGTGLNAAPSLGGLPNGANALVNGYGGAGAACPITGLNQGGCAEWGGGAGAGMVAAGGTGAAGGISIFGGGGGGSGGGVDITNTNYAGGAGGFAGTIGGAASGNGPAGGTAGGTSGTIGAAGNNYQSGQGGSGGGGLSGGAGGAGGAGGFPSGGGGGGAGGAGGGLGGKGGNGQVIIWSYK